MANKDASLGQESPLPDTNQEVWAKLGSLVKHASEAIIGLSLEGTVEIWNSGAVRLYGYSESEIIGRNISLVLPPGQENELYGLVDLIKQGQPVKPYETVNLTREGRLIEVSITVSPMKDALGVISGVSAIVRGRTGKDIVESEPAQPDLRNNREPFGEKVEAHTPKQPEAETRPGREIYAREAAPPASPDGEEHLIGLMNLSPDIIYRVKEDGRIDFISLAVRQLGYEPSELMGRPFEDLVHPDDRPQIRDVLVERRIGGRRVDHIIIRLIGKDPGGSDQPQPHHLVELSARGFWDVLDSEIHLPDKHFLYTLGIAHDVTAYQQAAEALRENERRIGLLKDVATAANAAVTLDNVFRVAVDGILRYIGWPIGHVYAADASRPEVLAPTEIWHLDDQDRYGKLKQIIDQTVVKPGVGLIGRILESGKPLWVEDLVSSPEFPCRELGDELQVHGAFGFPIIVRGKVSAILEFFSSQPEAPNASWLELMGEIGFQLGIVIERKQAEETLKKFYRAIEQSPATVVITDVTGKIQYVNPKFSTLTGFTSAEVIGQNPGILGSGIHPTSFYRELWQTILAGQEWYGQFCNKKKNGEIYWERASISPVRNELGQITNFVAVKEDITELLQYERELKQAKESAENANRAQSDFLSGMSHELRTPLNAIIGFSEVIKEQYFGPLTPKQEEYVTDILESGQNLLALINDILDLAKVAANKTTLELSVVNIHDLINSSLMMVKEKAAKHGIVLDRDIDREVQTLEIIADEKKLKQVLFSLISNAVKSTQDGGSVRLTAHYLPEIQPAAPDRNTSASTEEPALGREQAGILEICVEDNGRGIIAEQRRKIIEPFYRTVGSQPGPWSGADLGLSLSRELVELHGGTIWAENLGPENGSRLAFRIPIVGLTDHPAKIW